jgi:hypothetical protein
MIFHYQKETDYHYLARSKGGDYEKVIGPGEREGARRKKGGWRKRGG